MKKVLKQLVKYAVEKKLIPVFGAGFTAGCEVYQWNCSEWEKGYRKYV